MEDSGFYKVVVKIEIECAFNEKTGERKYKKTKENYIVRAGSTKEASEKVEEMFKDFTESWRIDSVKEENIVSIVE